MSNWREIQLSIHPFAMTDWRERGSCGLQQRQTNDQNNWWSVHILIWIRSVLTPKFENRRLECKESQLTPSVCPLVLFFCHSDTPRTTGQMHPEQKHITPYMRGRSLTRKGKTSKKFSRNEKMSVSLRIFLPWNQVDLIFGKSGQPLFWALVLRIRAWFLK